MNDEDAELLAIEMATLAIKKLPIDHEMVARWASYMAKIAYKMREQRLALDEIVASSCEDAHVAEQQAMMLQSIGKVVRRPGRPTLRIIR